MKMNESMKAKLYEADKTRKLIPLGINRGFFNACEDAAEIGNELLNFTELNSAAIPLIVENIREADITEFTVSEATTKLLSDAEIFEANGCKVVGLTTTKVFGGEVVPALLFKVL